MSTFEADLIQSLQEASELAKSIGGDASGPNVDPRKVRARAKLTQAEMAPLMGMSLSGYRKWEQGQRAVNGPALNLLRVLDSNPKAVIEALR
jgi:putative transcriptional regulator